MKKETKKVFEAIFTFLIFFELTLMLLNIFGVIDGDGFWFTLAMVVIGILLCLFIFIYFFIKRETKEKEMLKNVIVSPDDIRKNIDKFLRFLEETVIPHEYDPDEYGVSCPRCHNEPVDHNTMKCNYCGFVMPEEFRLPSSKVLVEALKEKIWKEDQEKRKIEKAKRGEMARQGTKWLEDKGFIKQ